MNNNLINKKEILIVDDSPEQIETAVHALKSSNYTVRVATKGSSALKLLEKRSPDLILLDIFMPQMDGFELCRNIKANENLKNIPVIFLTSSDDEDSIKKGFDSGAQDYVTKPFNPTELLARVKTHIKLKEQAQSLLDANRELDSFCYTIAHDLKAPLLSISKLIEYFAEDYKEILDINASEILSGIYKKSQELTGIIEHLLEFSRMCELTMNPDKIDMNKLFSNVWNELISAYPEKKFQIKIGVLPQITGDAIMMRLLVTNVLSNCIKYTGTREISKVEVQCTEHQNHYIFCVSDNGVGFDMKYSSRLFQVFQRLHSAKEFAGTGVGLSICQRILKRHNGLAWMTAEVDNGASFYFSLLK
jgi:two-component system sensor histidine kinase/response regulator